MKCSARPIFPTTLWCCAKPDQARSDFAALQSDLQFFMSQLARLPTPTYLGRILLLTTASLWTLLAAVALWLKPF
jgi:hypothetical protein